MPIYEYHCEACQQEFEYLLLGDTEPDLCPHCQSPQVCRLMSTCGFLSKGSAGETTSRSAGASACGSCSGSNCSGCSH